MTSHPSATNRGERIDVRIDAVYRDLPPQERRAADFMLEHLGDLAIFSASDISRRAGVSKATVTRLFRSLGFEDFKEVREHVVSVRSTGLPLAAPVSSGDGVVADELDRHIGKETENLTQLVHTLSAGGLARAVELISAAQKLLLIGFRNSYPLASHLHQQLIQARDGVRLAPQPGQTVGEEITGLDASDVVVIFGFRRRHRLIEPLVKALKAQGVNTIFVGDPTSRYYAQDVSLWLNCPINSDGAFDSYAAPMSLITILANGVLNTSPNPGRRRISAVSSAYTALGELEP